MSDVVRTINMEAVGGSAAVAVVPEEALLEPREARVTLVMDERGEAFQARNQELSSALYDFTPEEARSLAHQLLAAAERVEAIRTNARRNG